MEAGLQDHALTCARHFAQHTAIVGKHPHLHRHRALGPVRLPEPRQLGPILLAAGASFAVLVYQRDLGASLLLFALFITMVYVATGRAAYLFTGLVLVGAGGYLAYENFDHVQRRVSAWLHPFDDFADSGYQIQI